MNSTEVEQYLSRIGVTRNGQSPYELLATIQRNHLLNVDFNNLHLIANQDIRYHWKDSFNAVVTQRGGGVCFELNNLLHHLLRALNYDVILVESPHVNRRGDAAIDHAANLVTVDGHTYLVDVADGFFSSRIPIPIDGEVIEDSNLSYKVRNDGDFYTVLIKRNKDWSSRNTFTNKSRCVDEFRSFTHSTTMQFLREYIYLVRTLENEKWIAFSKRIRHWIGREVEMIDIDEQHLKATIHQYFDVRDEMIPSRFPIETTGIVAEIPLNAI